MAQWSELFMSYWFLLLCLREWLILELLLLCFDIFPQELFTFIDCSSRIRFPSQNPQNASKNSKRGDPRAHSQDKKSWEGRNLLKPVRFRDRQSQEQEIAEILLFQFQSKIPKQESLLGNMSRNELASRISQKECQS